MPLNQFLYDRNAPALGGYNKRGLIIVLALDVRVDFETLDQPSCQIYVPRLTSHIERRLFTYRRLIQLEALGDKELHDLQIVHLTCLEHCLFYV